MPIQNALATVCINFSSSLERHEYCTKGLRKVIKHLLSDGKPLADIKDLGGSNGLIANAKKLFTKS